MTEYQLIVDSCEQPRQRPQAYQDQKTFFSGKQKRHTFKNQFIVTPNGKEIVDVVIGKPGKSSDINIWRERQYQFSSLQKFQGDKAYVGEPAIKCPYKRTSHQSLSETQKQSNREQAKIRIFVEHLIRLIKIFRVASERFRLKASSYESVIQVVCGLIRWRLGAIVFNN